MAAATPGKVVAMAGEGSSHLELIRLAAAQRERGDPAAAERSLLAAIELKHDCAAAHHVLGLVYLALGQCEDAIDSLHLAAHFDPCLVAAHLDLGTALLQLARYAEAEAACRRALDLDARLPAAWFLMGGIHKSRQELERAVECYQTAVTLEPESSGMQCQLAFVLSRVGRHSESRACYAAALRLNPEFAEAHHNLGLLLLETGYPDEALASFEHAARLKPASIETQTCVAHALRDLGRLELALAQYDRVLDQQPQLGDAVINRAYALLMREDYAAGWNAYERRYDASRIPPRDFPFPQWRGELLTGKRILIYAEQGLGDEIMFAACLPDIIARAAHATIECDARLASLFALSFPAATVRGAVKGEDRGWQARLPHADFQIPIGSLPRYCRATRDAFPVHAGYLTADAARVEHWRNWLGADRRRLRAGIAWRGGLLRTRQLLRSTQLTQWAPVLACNDVDFVGLQYGQTADELAQGDQDYGRVIRMAPGIENPGELAALMSSLDLVITVDSTVAHLAGALGRPLWILLPFSAEWRYLRAGSAMPWYPSATLFRQPCPRDWDAVFAAVRRELLTIAASHCRG